MLGRFTTSGERGLPPVLGFATRRGAIESQVERSRLNAGELQASLQRAAAAAALVDVEGPDRADVTALLRGPASALHHALVTALETLDEAMRPHGEAPDGDEVGDVASMARWELRNVRAELVSLQTDSEPDDVLATMAKARHRTVSSLVAVEEALCRREGLPSRLAPLADGELNRSLALRAAWAEFRGAVRAGGTPDESMLPAQLITAARLLQKLGEGPERRSLRIHDRGHVRGLLDRIERWIGGEDGWSAESGARLWADLTAFAELLGQINNRSELRGHDRKVATELLLVLPSVGPSAEALDALRSLRGRDEALDALLATEPLPMAEILVRLRAVAIALGEPAGGR